MSLLSSVHTLTSTHENFQISVCEVIFVSPLEPRWEDVDQAGLMPDGLTYLVEFVGGDGYLYKSLLFILLCQDYLSKEPAVPISCNQMCNMPCPGFLCRTS